MIKKEIIVLSLCAMFFAGIMMPAAKADAFSFGDLQNQIVSIPQKIAQWFQRLRSTFGLTEKIAVNEVADNVPKVNEKSAFNPEKNSIEGCKNESDIVNGSAGEKCCAGLQPLQVITLGDGAKCGEKMAAYVCAKCGDGICGKGENKCSCPQDCQQGTKEMTCDQGCKTFGYQKSYCNAVSWKETETPYLRELVKTCNNSDFELPSTWLGKNDISGDMGPMPEYRFQINDCNGDNVACCCKDKSANQCVFDRDKNGCCRGDNCSKIILNCGTGYAIEQKSIFCDSQCRPVVNCTFSNNYAEQSCSVLCRKYEMKDCDLKKCDLDEKEIKIDTVSGYGCYCAKNVCAKEGESRDTLECCAGLKEVSDLNSDGIDILCINPAKMGSICTFDRDCAPGLKCKSFLGAASGKDMNSHCIDLSNQKEGADCTFDDDCAPGFNCDYGTCAKRSQAEMKCVATGGDWHGWSDGTGNCSCGIGMKWASDDEGCMEYPFPCVPAGKILDLAERKCCAGLTAAAAPADGANTGSWICSATCAKAGQSCRKSTAESGQNCCGYLSCSDFGFCVEMPVVPMKPVIYLYPEKTQAVNVKLDYAGELIADYPDYDPISGWNVTANPDGRLINRADGKEYSYLFWEGNDYGKIKYDLSRGFVVKGTDTKQFLQDILAKIGLTPKEYNEFIVYWYPKMKDNPYNIILFVQEEYTSQAKLTISPQPDSVLRVFMVYKPSSIKVEIVPQTFIPFGRKGFAVVEWGGSELK